MEAGIHPQSNGWGLMIALLLAYCYRSSYVLGPISYSKIHN